MLIRRTGGGKIYVQVLYIYTINDSVIHTCHVTTRCIRYLQLEMGVLMLVVHIHMVFAITKFIHLFNKYSLHTYLIVCTMYI